MSYDGYNGSNSIRIILQTNLDFSAESPSAQKIIYKKKPGEGTEKEWTATVLTGSETTGKIYYDMLSSESLSTGTWMLRAKLTYSDGRVFYTAWTNLEIGD